MFFLQIPLLYTLVEAQFKIILRLIPGRKRDSSDLIVAKRLMGLKLAGNGTPRGRNVGVAQRVMPKSAIFPVVDAPATLESPRVA